MTTFWIARDKITGTVHLFDRMPTSEYGMFTAGTNFDEGMCLGKRPKLPFTLPRGHRAKVGIAIVSVQRDGSFITRRCEK